MINGVNVIGFCGWQQGRIISWLGITYCYSYKSRALSLTACERYYWSIVVKMCKTDLGFAWKGGVIDHKKCYLLLSSRNLQQKSLNRSLNFHTSLFCKGNYLLLLKYCLLYVNFIKNFEYKENWFEKNSLFWIYFQVQVNVYYLKGLTILPQLEQIYNRYLPTDRLIFISIHVVKVFLTIWRHYDTSRSCER